MNCPPQPSLQMCTCFNSRPSSLNLTSYSPMTMLMACCTAALEWFRSPDMNTCDRAHTTVPSLAFEYTITGRRVDWYALHHWLWGALACSCE